MTPRITSVLLAIATIILPGTVSAAALFKMPHVPAEAAVGSTIVVPIDITIPGEVGVNALSMQLSLDGPATITAVETGDSVFSFWPENTVSTSSATLVGGSPSSVAGTTLRIAQYALALNAPGTVRVHISGTGYEGDGAGTPLALAPQTFEIAVAASGTPIDQLASSVSRDTTPPEPFTVTLGRDQSVASGAYFLSFHTTDAGTGVARYEVAEGNAVPEISDGLYVLHDQSLKTAVTVKAIDGAGNVRTLVWSAAPQPGRTTLYAAIAAALLVCLIYVAYSRRRRRLR